MLVTKFKKLSLHLMENCKFIFYLNVYIYIQCIFINIIYNIMYYLYISVMYQQKGMCIISWFIFANYNTQKWSLYQPILRHWSLSILPENIKYFQGLTKETSSMKRVKDYFFGKSEEVHMKLSFCSRVLKNFLMVNLIFVIKCYVFILIFLLDM